MVGHHLGEAFWAHLLEVVCWVDLWGFLECQDRVFWVLLGVQHYH